MYASPDRYIPQCVAHRRPQNMWATVVAVAGLLVALILGAPLAQANGYRFLSLAIYEAFSFICHQGPERSFFIAGHRLAVCARCSGLYVGFAAAVIMYPLITSLKRTNTPDRKWLFLAAAPVAIDFGLGFLGIWGNTHLSRFSTGALLGAVAVFYVMPGLAELSLRWRPFPGSPAKRNQLQTTATPEQVAAAPTDYSAPHRRI